MVVKLLHVKLLNDRWTKGEAAVHTIAPIMRAMGHMGQMLRGSRYGVEQNGPEGSQVATKESEAA